MTRSYPRGRWQACFIAVLVVLASAGTARATTVLTVNTTSDAGTPNPSQCLGAPGDCSLRQAADIAEGGDVIVVPASANAYALTQGQITLGNNVTILGGGARQTTIQSNGSFRIFSVLNATTLTIAGVTLTGGGGVQEGGAIRNSGTLTLNGVTVRGNAVGSPSPQGGGIFTNGQLTVTDSTISGNNATSTDASTAGGGGIYDDLSILNVTNSTISGNSATGNSTAQGHGGGIYSAAEGNVYLTSATIASNGASGAGGSSGGNLYNEETTSLGWAVNTIIALATAGGNCAGLGALTSNGHNLEDGTSCGFTQQTDIHAGPQLAALAANGGQTDTRALLSGSPAIDVGDQSNCGTKDQRGFPRPDNGEPNCDIGAYEFQDSKGPPPKRPTSTGVVCLPNPDWLGHETKCTATVRDIGSGVRKTPAGTVSFHTNAQGSFDKSSCTLSSGACTVHYKPTAIGTGQHKITAAYGGSKVHVNSAGADTLAVNPTATTVACQPSPVRIGVKMTCKMTVRDVGGAQLSTPTGKVRIATAAIGTFDHTTCTLKKTNSIAASCAVHFTPKRPGLITLRSSYGGDAKHAGSQDKFFTNVDEGKTESALKCQPNPDRIGVKTTCNMTVLDVGGAQQSAPTGVVTFKNERTPQGVFEHSTCYLKPNKKKKNKANCWVHYTPRTYVHDVRASYSGDARHATTRAHETLYVDLGKTRMRVGCGPQPAHRGASVHCLVEVWDVGGAQRSTPTGGVSFKTGGQGTFSSKHCSLKNLTGVTAFCEVYYKPTRVGSHSITGNYGGDGRHMATSDTEVLRVK